jgi:type II secretory pathway pseudopilin PulG
MLWPSCRGVCAKRLTNRSRARCGARRYNNKLAFTIIELLVVIGIIIALAGLILATSGYVQKKGARSRAEAEIAAISAALENYKADNGIYPTNPDTDALNPSTDVDPVTGLPNKYSKASLYLYQQISGDSDGDRVVDQAKSYMAFKPNMLLPAPPSTATVVALRDPFGNSYGYSTAKASNPSGSTGFNPTFDFWSTAGGRSTADQTQWIKNW